MTEIAERPEVDAAAAGENGDDEEGKEGEGFHARPMSKHRAAPPPMWSDHTITVASG